MRAPGERAQPINDRARPVPAPKRELAPDADHFCGAFDVVETRNWPPRLAKEAWQINAHPGIRDAAPRRKTFLHPRWKSKVA